MLLFLLLL